MIVCMGGDAIELSSVGGLSALCEDAKVFKNVVLGVCTNPLPVPRALGRSDYLARGASKPNRHVPNVIVD